MLSRLWLGVWVGLLFWPIASCGSNEARHETQRPDGGSPVDGEHDAEPAQPDAAASNGMAEAGGADAALADAGASTPGTDGASPAPDQLDGSAGPTPRCGASEQASAPLGKDSFVANTGKTAVTAITYTNVGAAGAYAQVVSGWSKATGCQGDPDGNLCKTVYRKEKRVDAALAPFDEEMMLVFAGPTELYQLAVYAPREDSWLRSAYWDRCASDGLVFAGNKHWHECAGFVESYVSADGSKESPTPVQFSGSIAAGTEVHVMSSALCSGSAASSDCGYSSGLPLHGFRGDARGSKLFAVKLRMPLGEKTPAYWILPAQVVRSAQYGCNCRGAGSDPIYKGGCGELDVAEILGGVTSSLEATSTLYSFQDITGGGSVTFARPVLESVTFLVIFDAAGRQIGIRRLAAEAFDFSAQLSAERVRELLADQGAQRALR